MSVYHIIDEPQVKRSENLIVNPTIILLVAIFLPFFWMPPFMGRWWLPFLWLAFNGYFLGSPSLKKEILISIMGLVFMFCLTTGFTYISYVEPYSQFKSLSQYAGIILNGTFFFILYLVVFKQNLPYELYNYMKER